MLGDTRLLRQRGRSPLPDPVLVVEPPDYFSADALEVWNRLAPDLIRRGLLTGWDVDAFGVLCTAIVFHRRAAAVVNEAGVVVDSGRPERGRVKNVAAQIVRDQAATIATFAARFGLTPADRQALQIPDESDSDLASRVLD